MSNFSGRLISSLFVIFVLLFHSFGFAQEKDNTIASPQTQNPDASQVTIPATSSPTFDQVIGKVVEREHLFVAQMRHFHPLVETYIQNLKGAEDAAVPVSDQYFLGRLDMTNGTGDLEFKSQSGFGRRFVAKLTSIYGMKFLPLGFAQMVLLDENLQREFYKFSFVRREFLGDIRCLVIDIQPKDDTSGVRFKGRMWVEDQDYNIVRFNGTYTPHQHDNYYLHFDTWRVNLRPGLWLPAFIYSEESNMVARNGQKLHFKAQTRLWGYDLQHIAHNEEFTQIMVDSPQSVTDQSVAAQDDTPVESERRWQLEAENNALERLQTIGLLAPPGNVDKVLQTVVNNLIVTNNLDIQPGVRTRVLLTSPLESFTVGHTIVLSRGLIDVLPDEGSLAMVLAHELSHIALGHKLDTKFAFNDRMFFPDEETFERIEFARPPADEDAADKKALELLTNSPYKDKLANAGLFLKALQERAPELKNLIRAHLGNSLANGKTLRMSALLNSAPTLDNQKTDQIAALPLGGRIKLDPWSNQIEFVKTKPVALISASEKMPFEVTPFFPHLARIPDMAHDKVAQTVPQN
ncbi:MAG TPA: M48 family metalloprotease [Terriglobales bacterium]|nr:M48 family metalloprotease [Terriglobales bacterium]